MADYVYNKLVIIGSDEQVKEVREFLKGKDSEGNQMCIIDFNKIAPMPEGVRNAVGQYLERTDTIRFTTVWAATLPLMKKLSEVFPDIVFLYEFIYYADKETYLIKAGVEIEMTETITGNFKLNVVEVETEVEDDDLPF